MKITINNIRTFSGRNIYSHRPVVMMEIDVNSLYDTATKDIKGFNKALLKILPELGKHHCSTGYEGGFAHRLEEGTYFPHVIEHIILELQNIMGYNIYFGKARLLSAPSIYFTVCEYKNERCAFECCKSSIYIVNGLLSGAHISIDSIISELRKITIESEPGPSTIAIMQEAKKRNIPVTRINDGSLLQLGYGRYSRLVEASMTEAASCINVDIASDKHLTKKILSENGIPVPYGDIAYTEESAVRIAYDIGYPVALKPFDGCQGKGVSLNLFNEDQVRMAYKEALKYSKIIIVENFIKGKDYRLLVVGDRVAAASERRPPSITGDGVHTIEELINIENEKPSRGDDHEKPLTKIKVDNTVIALLSTRGMNVGYVPSLDEVIYLRDNGNLSTGGTAMDCTDEVHPYNRILAVKAAEAIGLEIAGIDITTENISEPVRYGKGAVIEVNAAPGLRMHLHPEQGKARNVAADIINMLYPPGQPSLIPIISITGTNGKTTTARLLKHVFGLFGKKAGMTSTSGIFIGNECILRGDNTGPVSAKMVLSNKNVDVAVLETARGGIIRKGLGYDLANVGVITNISEDHLGVDGLNTIEDMAFVKALVVEAIRPDGYAVLNADDSMTEYMLKRTVSNVILFSKKEENALLKTHMQNGKKTVFIKGNDIVIYTGKKLMQVLKVEDVPITFGGRAECNIENTMAAVSALYAMKVPYEIIRDGLRSFKPNALTNPGRFNIFDMGGFKVMLDYCHNIAGYQAVISFLKKNKALRLVGIIGMPGDRPDKNIMDVGEMCGRVFERIYIKEDGDLRGRAPGEVADLLYDAVLKAGAKKNNVEVIFSESVALTTALEQAQDGELILMCYEEFEPVLKILEDFRKEIRLGKSM